MHTILQALSMIKPSLKLKKLNKKGISGLVEAAGLIAVVVAAIIIVLPQSRAAISNIWRTVTNNAMNFFNTNSQG
ncbi:MULTISPECIES: hypothetical protein [Clostridium]|jgi:hypothetical protein|uniref:hypothetical protein n=1 Tax=Clostridium TaxID=1485 RepID=UPI0024330D29|nr:hypothetical protein [Clostridium tyrobutyricum]